MNRRTIQVLAAVAALALLVGGGVADGKKRGGGGKTFVEIAKNNMIIYFGGKISPRALPRTRQAPIAMSMSTSFERTDGLEPPQLSRVDIDLNKYGNLYRRGLPTCTEKKLKDTTSKQALRRCRNALVGHGRVFSEVRFPEQAPLPGNGKLLAFNGRVGKRPAIVTHVYGTEPLPTTYTLPFVIRRAPGGLYGVRLAAKFPELASDWGHIKAFSLTLKKVYRHRGKKRSYISAACAVPKRLGGALFSMARAIYQFEDGTSATTDLQRTCKAKRR